MPVCGCVNSVPYIFYSSKISEERQEWFNTWALQHIMKSQFKIHCKYFFRGGIFFRDSRGCVRGMVHFRIRHPVYSSSQENGVSGQQNWSHSILIYDILTVMLMKDKSRPISDLIVSLFSCFQICEGRYEHCWPAGDPPLLRLSDPVASDDGHRGAGPEHRQLSGRNEENCSNF